MSSQLAPTTSVSTFKYRPVVADSRTVEHGRKESSNAAEAGVRSRTQRNGVSFCGCPGGARPPESCPEGMADPDPRPYRLVRPLRGATPRGTHRGGQSVLQH